LPKNSTIIAIVSIVVIVGAILYIFSGDIFNGSQNDESKSITIKLAETVNEAKEWVPSTVYLKKGDKIELTVVNGDDDDVHRLAIPDLNIETNDIPGANGREVISFSVEETGTFIFNDPLAPDWNSPECQVDEESEIEEVEEILAELKGLVEELENAMSNNEVDQINVRFSEAFTELKENERPHTADSINELQLILNSLESSPALDEVSIIAESMREVLEELEEDVEELICIPPGQIIVEP
jgi:hypothetical protein